MGSVSRVGGWGAAAPTNLLVQHEDQRTEGLGCPSHIREKAVVSASSYLPSGSRTSSRRPALTVPPGLSGPPRDGKASSPSFLCKPRMVSASVAGSPASEALPALGGPWSRASSGLHLWHLTEHQRALGSRLPKTLWGPWCRLARIPRPPPVVLHVNQDLSQKVPVSCTPENQPGAGRVEGDPKVPHLPDEGGKMPEHPERSRALENQSLVQEK